MAEKPTSNDGGSSDNTPGSVTAGSLSEFAAAFEDKSGTHVTPKWLGKRIGRFRLLSLLGQGSWGRVFEAEDRSLKRRVALKVLRSRGRGSTKETTAKVLHEARAVAGLEHPNIAQVYEIGEAHNLLFIAMELQPGGTLKEAVHAHGPLAVDRACRLCADAADALHFAHQNGVLHRDIKPGNLMLSRTGTCKVVDFGLAQIDDPSDPGISNRTAGTPHYVAPEVVCNNPASPRADLYSLACTLFFLLTGRKPFEHLTDPANRGNTNEREAVLRAQMDEPIAPVTDFRSDVPDGLTALMEQALSKDPSQRPKDLGTFAKALRTFAALPANASGSVAPLPPAATTPTPMTARRPAKRKTSSTPLILGGVAAVVVVGVLVTAGMLTGDDREDIAAVQPPAEEPAVERPAVELPAEEPVETRPPIMTPPVERLAPIVVPEPEAEPTPEPVEPPAEQKPVASDAISVSDRDALMAADGSRVTVEGNVSFARLSGTGKVFTVGFEGVNIRDGFTLAWFPRDFEAMAQAFGGEHGEGIHGNTIRVTGTVSIYRDKPQMVVNSPDQIEVIE
ncbi:MAG: serine/threonine-protein kinase [Planctomycetota bacterium]